MYAVICHNTNLITKSSGVIFLCARQVMLFSCLNKNLQLCRTSDAVFVLIGQWSRHSNQSKRAFHILTVHTFVVLVCWCVVVIVSFTVCWQWGPFWKTLLFSRTLGMPVAATQRGWHSSSVCIYVALEKLNVLLPYQRRIYLYFLRVCKTKNRVCLIWKVASVFKFGYFRSHHFSS